MAILVLLLLLAWILNSNEQFKIKFVAVPITATLMLQITSGVERTQSETTWNVMHLHHAILEGLTQWSPSSYMIWKLFCIKFYGSSNYSRGFLKGTIKTDNYICE